ncbi:MAG: hypothetical protein PVG14_15930, partial [Anaerolineales bacterium]
MRWKEIPLVIKICIYVFMITFAVMTLVPFMYFISLSLSDYSETFVVFLWPNQFKWQNYLEAWKTINVGIYYRNSIYVTSLGLFLNLAAGAMAAFALARYKFSGREPIYSLILAG